MNGATPYGRDASSAEELDRQQGRHHEPSRPPSEATATVPVQARMEHDSGARSDKAHGKKQTQGERLHETVAQADVDLFHDAEHRAYATFEVGGHRETWPIRSTGFRRYVSWLFYQQEAKAPRAADVADFLATLEGQAQFDGGLQRVYVRLAPTDGGIVIDAGNPEWSAIEVDRRGWRVVPDPPVKFLRPRGMMALPTPRPGGSVETLRDFLNVSDDDQWKLVVGFLVGMYRPSGPYPVLALHGEQGAAKSTAMRVLRKLIDPRETLDRSAPRDDHDLAIHAMHNLVIALDNLSGIPERLSDALARLATGSGFATRQLYTDSDEFSFNAARPIMINGIGDVIERSDLLDRALLVHLAPIEADKRRLEADFWASFDSERPGILGALLDVVACALDREGRVQLRSWPRMADFARWVTAAEPALGWEDGDFLKAYYANRGQAHELAIDADPVAVALRDFLAPGHEWQGSATALLDALGKRVGEAVTKREDWPGAAHVLSNRLARLAPNLRAIGILVEHDRSGKHGRLITVKCVQTSDTSDTSDTHRHAQSGDAGSRSE